jgi:hypothetical protein
LDLGEIGRGGVDWIGLDNWRALVNAVMYLRVPENAGNVSSGSRAVLSSVELVVFCIELRGIS